MNVRVTVKKLINTHELCLNCEEVGSEKILEVTCGERVRENFFCGYELLGEDVIF